MKKIELEDYQTFVLLHVLKTVREMGTMDWAIIDQIILKIESSDRIEKTTE